MSFLALSILLLGACGQAPSTREDPAAGQSSVYAVSGAAVSSPVNTYVLASSSCTGDISSPERGVLVFGDSGTFAESFRSSFPWDDSQSVPVVDFDRYWVLGAFGGSGICGTAVNIASVEELDEYNLVAVETDIPAQDCWHDSSESFPFTYVATRYSTKPFKVSWTDKRVNCSP
jgi:hypothetical protein